MTPKTSKTQIKLFSEMQEENKRLIRKDRTLQRDANLRKFYYNLFNNGLRSDWALTQTAQHFNLSERQTHNIIMQYVRKAA